MNTRHNDKNLLNSIIMKTDRIILTGILLLCMPVLAYSQSIEDSVTIRIGGIKKNHKDQTEIEKATTGIYYRFTQKVYKEKDLTTLSDTFLLATGNSQSVFLDPYFKDNMQRWFKANMNQARKANKPSVFEESLEDIIDLRNAGTDHVVGNNGEAVQIYKNRTSLSVTSCLTHVINGGKVECVQQIPECQQWLLTDETDTIFNYPCKKATVNYGGRHYTAWYTSELPINDGPWKFFGLPGLILKVEDSEQFFIYEAFGLQQYDNAVIVKDKDDYEKCNLEQFNRLADKRRSGIPTSFLYDGCVHFVTIHPYTYIPMEKEANQ